MPYSYVNLTTALADLGRRLYDPDSTFWTDAEKTAYLNESLRTWNAVALYHRSEFTFLTVASTPWYDIASTAIAPNTVRPMSRTDQDILSAIEYHLLEPQTASYPLSWAGSAQFDIADILSAIESYRDAALGDTACTVTRALINANPSHARTYLPDDTIDIRRIAWLPVSSPSGYTNTPLWPDDQWALGAYQRDFTVTAQGIPSTYRQASEPPLAFDVDIRPAVNGQYDVITVDAGSALSTAASTVLPIPNDFDWVVKFGALMDVLSRESNARDDLRAKYCELRYKQGIGLLRHSPAILAIRIADTVLDIDSAQNTDNFRPGWQAESASTPDQAIVAGLNLIGFAPIPDGVHSVTVHCVRNAPLPALGTDNLQIGRDIYDSILEYAHHLAAFKLGGAEFLATLPMLDRFYRQAMTYNGKLSQLGEFVNVMTEISQLNEQANPVFALGDGDADGG